MVVSRETESRRAEPTSLFPAAADPRRAATARVSGGRLVTPRQRLASLVEQHELGDAAVPALTALLQALADPAAPTSVHRASQAVDVHIADSLAALAVEGLSSADRVVDLGSGAGLPGLALAVAMPNARLTLIESHARKCAFIRDTAESMALQNVRVIQSRVEEWRDGLGEHDCVCARAVASLPVLIEYAAPLLRRGGTLVAWKGEVGRQEAADGAAAASILGCEPAGVLPVTPFTRSERRTLHLFKKSVETPSRFPRRAGMAAKRPLSAST